MNRVFSVEFFNDGFRDMTMWSDERVAKKKACSIICEQLSNGDYGLKQTNLINRMINESKFDEAIDLFKDLNEDMFVSVHSHLVQDKVDLSEQDVIVLSLVR